MEAEQKGETKDQFKKAIAEQVATLAGITEEQAYQLIETPHSSDHGDLAIPVARINKFKKLQGKPNDFAQKWAKEIKPNEFIVSANAEGPYLNFFINKVLVASQVLPEVFKLKDQWGTNKSGEGKTVIVEYSSPNIAKPFHAGHLRTTIIGNFLKNVYKANGYKVVSINYLGDWGKQYGLLAVGFAKYGSEEELVKRPIRHLYDVYVKINKDAKTTTTVVDPETKKEKEVDRSPEEIERAKQIHDEARAYFKKMEDGDEAALAQWKRFRDLSIAEYKTLYKRLNIEFDEYSGESFYGEGSKEAAKKLKEMGLLTEDKGAQIVNLEKMKLGKPIVIKSDGTGLYLTRDIAAAVDRYNRYQFDKMIYVVGAPQTLHFQQLFKILELMGYKWVDRCRHVSFGHIKGMSTRSGTATFLEDILLDAKDAMLKRIDAEKAAEITDLDTTADIVGISAVIIQDFGARIIKDYEYDLERCTKAEGDTGPYLQYAHARLSSMERKNPEIEITDKVDFSLLSEPVAQALVMKISRYPSVIVNALEQGEPCTLVTYLLDLCHTISSAHAELWVKGRETNIATARMLLFWAARVTLANGLRILGLTPLERM